MMDEQMGFNPNDLKKYEAFVKLQQKTSKSLKGYYETLKNVKILEENIIHLTKQRSKIEETLIELREREIELKKTLDYKTNEEYLALKKRLKLEQENLKKVDEELRQGKEAAKLAAETLNTQNAMLATTRSMGYALKFIGVQLLSHSQFWLEQQKAVKVAGFNMGVLSSQAADFTTNLYAAGLGTAEIGMSVKDLAEMQSVYSEEVGRMVTLTEQGNISMAELAAGTVLGKEGAREMAAEMDKFNVSAVGTAKFMEDTLNESHKMGLNGEKVTKNIKANLAMAQKYAFKDGIKGLAKMAQLATKYKIEMSSIGDLAEKLYDPEGAVEMSAKLQVLGGEWAQMADPFNLMFKARNDMEGLTKELINATGAVGKFDEKTGELKFSSLEMSKLRAVAEATGQSYENLANMASEVAKNNRKMSQIRGNFDPETKEFLSSISQMDEKGTFFIEMGGKRIDFNQLGTLSKTHIDELKNEQSSLRDRAKQAQTFDETWQNIVMEFKTAFLPGFKSFSESVEGGLGKFKKWMADNNVIDKVVSFGKVIGEFGATVVKWVADNPILTSVGLGLALLAKETAWFWRGKILGYGFNSTASAGGKGPLGGGGGKNPAGSGPAGGGGAGYLGTSTGAGFGANFKGAAGNSMVRLGGAIAGLTAAYTEWSENSDNGMSTGENAGRTTLKGLGAGGGAWGGAAAGAAIGAAFGGIGAIPGALIGGALGAWGGGALGEASGDAIYGDEKVQQDFIARPGSKPIPFSSADTLVGLKKDGGLGKALINGGGNSDGETLVRFANSITINGTLNINSGGQTAAIDLNNPFIIRELTTMIQEELSRNLGGGKLSSNPKR